MSIPRPVPANNFGTDGDHCPECASDWRKPHREDCSQFHQCEFPPGCDKDAQFGRRLCPEHYRQISALFGPAE
jgi:hypothetical protein